MATDRRRGTWIDPSVGRITLAVYRTGDLVRWTAGGDLEFIGRVDDQVKLRGFRIELGEIEEALRAHPDLARAVVVVRRIDGEQRLLGYVSEVDGRAPSDGVLRAWLTARLPGYMVPEVFVVVDSFPTTRAGKVDRAAVPTPEAVRPELAQAYVPPRTDTERDIAAIWADVLHVDRVGVHDNFFELGGTSIRLLSVHTRLRDQGIDEGIRLADLFRFPTVSQLAGSLSASDGGATAPHRTTSAWSRPSGSPRHTTVAWT